MKPIDLVRKVTSLGLALRKRTGADGADDARDVEAPRTREPLARRATVRLLHVTTMVAKQMQHMPLPLPRPAERVALSIAASQLRALVGSALVRDAVSSDRDPTGGDATARALVELVHQTLALVDKALAMDPELARAESHELTAGAQSDRAPDEAPSTDRPTPTPSTRKVSF